MGQVRKDKKPYAYEGVLLPEGVEGVGVLSARNGVFLDHISIACGDNRHDDSRSRHSDQGSQGAAFRQECGSRKDECAPTDDAAQGKRPNVNRLQASIQRC